MASRITFGDGYETENQDGETVTRHKFWVDVSSSLMNRLTAVQMSDEFEYENPREVLSAIVGGELDVDSLEE